MSDDEEGAPDVPAEVRREVRNAHYNLGHPSTAVLLRIMRKAGASADAQRYAKWWKCPLCHERKPPGKVPKVTAPYRPKDFNAVVGVDLKPVWDSAGTRYEALNMLDLATGYQVFGLMRGASASSAVECFQLWWSSWAGPPSKVVFGMDTAFQACFTDLTDRYAAPTMVVPVEAPWQLGMVERHGGVLAEIIAMTVRNCKVVGRRELKLAIIAACGAKNRRPGLSGHSPRSHVFGVQDRLDGSVIDSLLDGERMPVHANALNNEDFQRALAIREAASKAVVHLDHSEKYHEAISRLPLPEHGPFLPGAQVYYWQAQGAAHRSKGRRRRQHDRWRGPATVIGRETREDGQRTAYWLSHGGRLRLVAAAHIRTASREEQLADSEIMKKLTEISNDLQVDRSQLVYDNLTGQEDPDESDDEDNDHERHDDGEDGDGGPPPAGNSYRTVSEPESERERDLFGSVDDQSEGSRDRDQDDIAAELFGDYDRDGGDETGYGPVRRPSARRFPYSQRDRPPVIFEETSEAEEPARHVEEVNVLRLKPSYKSRKGRELDARHFDATEHEAFLEADAAQWEKHLKLGAVEVIPPEKTKGIPLDKILPVASRFVRTNKGDEGTFKPSSRLVLPGHLQRGAATEDGGERTDAPTVPQLGLMLVLTVAASNKWKIESFDVSAAFLRGDALEEELYFRPPKEGLPGVPKGALIRALKGVFGLRIAPRLWWKKARADIIAAGFQELSLLPGVFLLRDKDQSGKEILVGLLVLHVDDGMHAGKGPKYDKAMEEIRKTFEVTEDKIHASSFTFLGRDLEQMEDFSVKISQRQYLADLKPIQIPKSRRAEPEAPLLPHEIGDLRSLVGQLAWPAKVCYPQLSYDVSDLQQRFNIATVAELVRANAVLRTAKKLGQEVTTMHVHGIDLSNYAVVSVTDASFAGQPKGGSQMGFAVLIADKEILEGKARAVMVDWGSKKIQRVVKSTIAAEAAAMSFGFDRAFFARAVLAEMISGREGMCQWIPPNTPLAVHLKTVSAPPTAAAPSASTTSSASTISSAPTTSPTPTSATAPTSSTTGDQMALATDCKSLYDLCIRPHSTPTEKRVMLDLVDVRQHLDGGNAVARWVPTDAMLVDCLTKHLADLTVMNLFLATGWYSCREAADLEMERVAGREARKAARRRKRAETGEQSSSLPA